MGLAVLAGLAALAVVGAEAVPTPAELAARVIVSGRTSTAVDVPVALVDQQIPVTAAGRPLTNTPGFRWWVSQHYALKTDYGDDSARLFLTLLELAYPQYVALLGSPPPHVGEARLAVVYGSSREKMEEAMASDLGYRWQFEGGGIALEGLRVAYQYPSGSLRYHQRYILIHEVAHLHLMCRLGTLGAVPGWLNEGLADAISSHVFDEQARRLTVFVHDKAAIPNFLDEGLRAFAESGRSLRDLHDQGNLGRGGNVLAVQFFLTDPARAAQFALYREALFALAEAGLQAKARSADLLEQTCGPWAELNRSSAAWLAGQRNTFHYVDWGWEQDGDTLWSYGWPQKGPYSRTDVLMPPGEAPAWQPLRMDCPLGPAPPQVGPVERGVPEPTVGALLDFSRNPARGCTGLGLGVVDPPAPEGTTPGYLRVLVEAGRTLVLDGGDLGLGTATMPLPGDVLAAVAADRHRLGLTLRIGVEALTVAVRAGPPTALRECRASLALTPAARRRLLERPGTILARDGYHGVTPLFDDRRRADPDLAVPAPANRWRFAGMPQLEALSRSCLRLGDAAPAGLVAARGALLAAVPGEATVQATTVADCAARLPGLVREVRRTVADDRLASQACADLLGIGLDLRVQSGPAPDTFQAVARVTGALSGAVTGEARLSVRPAAATLEAPATEALQIAAGDAATVVRTGRVPPAVWPVEVEADLDLRWAGEHVHLTRACSVSPTLPGWWVYGPFPNPGGGRADVVHPPEQDLAPAAPPVLPAGQASAWRRVERGPANDVTKPFVVDLAALLGDGRDVAAYALAWLAADAEADALLTLGSDDGVVVWLNGIRVHSNLVDRALTVGSDCLPVHLRRGRNALLVKILQSTGAWSFAVGLTDPAGGPLRGVAFSPEAPAAGPVQP